MRIIDAINKKKKDSPNARTPIIACLGDSITQGCFELCYKDGDIQSTYDSCEGYPEKLKRILALLYPDVPVSIINAGIEGTTAELGYKILERDILPLKPDLLIVCYGLNDNGQEEKGLLSYKKNLKQIFILAHQFDIEVIFMTPNMMNTDSSNAPKGLEDWAEVFARRQNEGIFDAYMKMAKEACREENVRICDCYAIWKRMYECGVDTTRLLANGMNHPVREMHELFAWQIVHIILGD